MKNIIKDFENPKKSIYIQTEGRSVSKNGLEVSTLVENTLQSNESFQSDQLNASLGSRFIPKAEDNKLPLLNLKYSTSNVQSRRQMRSSLDNFNSVKMKVGVLEMKPDHMPKVNLLLENRYRNYPSIKTKKVWGGGMPSRKRPASIVHT